jgi:heat shock protein HslJ
VAVSASVGHLLQVIQLRTMIKKVIIFTIIISSVFVLYACKRKKNTDNLPLLNTKWLLEELFEAPIVQGFDTAFIMFNDTYKFSGNLGCNLFFGEFSFGKKRIKIDYCGATKKYCMDMRLEEQFAKALRHDITHYYIEKNKLYLLCQNKTVCKFEGVTSSE